MLVIRKFNTPCPSCGRIGTYGNVSVNVATLIRGCGFCNHREVLQLPKLKKKIIYLDQFFLSHAFRDNKPEFVSAAERIVSLSKKQIIVCPWSRIHDLETHLWRHTEQEKLWSFIKQISRGNQFSPPESIKSLQVQRAFDYFIPSSERKDVLGERDALRRDVHSWDNYIYVEVGSMKDNIDLIRKEKEESTDALVKLFDTWVSKPKSFEEDRIEEATGYAKVFVELYIQAVEAYSKGDIDGYLNTSADSAIIQLLMHRDQETMNMQERFNRMGKFLSSANFREIPFVDLSSLIYAVLRGRVRSGEFANRDKAKNRLSGLFYDIQAISMYGPYCHAMFIDKPMYEWLKKYKEYLATNYSLCMFSAASWGSFHQYLDSLEAECPEEVLKMLDVVYPMA